VVSGKIKRGLVVAVERISFLSAIGRNNAAIDVGSGLYIQRQAAVTYLYYGT
jgi:hypothetical protein